MRRCVPYLLVVLCALSACVNQPTNRPTGERPPSTYFWVVPESSLTEGNSQQHVHWWGQDPDGIVVGYLFASGKFLTPAKSLPQPDTIGWTWTTETDTNVTFPLLVKRDTFDIAVRAVDNQFKQTLQEQAIVRFTSQGVAVAIPYWDQNNNGKFDSSDVPLPTLATSVDPKGAVQPVPLLNRPPSVVFAQDPNNPSATMQQPDTTFTVATFAWTGTDPDGDGTISRYEFALNDTTDPSHWASVPGTSNIVTIAVPRSRSDVGDSTANIYTGTTFLNAKLVGTISGMRMNQTNRFFLRARDIAGDVSRVIFMPDTTGAKQWFVKKPKGRFLVVGDFIDNVTGSSAAVKRFYDTVLTSGSLGPLITSKFSGYDWLDIARGLRAADKNISKIGPGVPPYIDPAFVFTLHLYDVVFWYTDPFPSLAVAQVSLYDYLHPGVYPHTGKVIYSAMFQTNSDPRRALRDFAPIDSVSSVDLVDKGPSGSFLFPRFGDTQISGQTPGGYWVYPDSTNLADVFPAMQFKTSFSNSLFMNPIFKRSDARYIYRIQDYNDPTSAVVRYDSMLTLSEFHSLALVGQQAWACGASGVIFTSSNFGETWVAQASDVSSTLESIYMVDQNDGWCVGDSGTILQTQNGGTTWKNVSIPTSDNLFGTYFSSSDSGVIVGNNGLIIRTTDGGSSWLSSTGATSQNLYAVHFASSTFGIAVGDTETVLRTTDGGASWQQVFAGNLGNPYRLYSVRMIDASDGYAVGGKGTVVKSNDSGKTWQRLATGGLDTLKAVYFSDPDNGWVGGTGGTLLSTSNGGLTWNSLATNSDLITQNIDGLAFNGTQNGLAVGGSVLTRTDLSLHPGGAIVLQTVNGGGTWKLKPRGGIYVGVMDNARQFVFMGVPLHLLNGDGQSVQRFFEYVLFTEFGF